MYLKRLEIYGFKSFGTKSVLDFADSEKVSNISAIVGPNGSGKSNIADAVRWVLGEQSSKTLRSKKSEDVIFVGSQTKPRSSFAEITMILADHDSFAVEINGKEYTLSEIAISRKLYRSGESEYLINGKKVRLIDIQQLLATFGFGQSSYTVIGQGMVDRLLFFNATERKVLFDEAAGVKQYEIKREQAVRKLEATDGNLIRLKDILTELEPRVINLRRLVKRAEGRKEIEAELGLIQNRYYLAQENELKIKLSKFAKDKAELNTKVAQKRVEIESLDRKIEENQKAGLPQEEQRAVEQKLEVATRERDELLQKVAYLEGRLNQGEQKLEQVKTEKVRLANEKVELAEKISFLTEKIKEEKAELKSLNEDKEKYHSELGELENIREKLNQEISEIEKDKDSISIDNLKNRQKELQEKRREVEDEIYQLKRSLSLAENTENEVAKLQSELAENDRKVAQILGEISEKEKSAAKVLSEIEKVEKEIAEYITEFNQAEVEVFESELHVIAEELKEIEEKGYSEFLAKSFFGKLNGIFAKAKKLVKSLNQKERTNFEETLRKLRQEQREAEAQVNRLLIEKERASSRLEFVKQKLSQLSESQVDKNTSQKKIAELEKVIQNILAELEKVSEEVAEKSKGANEQKQKIYAKINEIHQEESALRRQLYDIEMSAGKKNGTIENQEREINFSSDRTVEIEKRLAEITNISIESDPESAKELATRKEELIAKDSILADLRKELSAVLSKQREQNQLTFELERERRSNENQVMNLQNELNQLSLEEARYSTRFEDLVEELRIAEIKLDRSMIGEALSQSDKDSLRVKMENLKRRLESIGGVDPETEAEYKELEERSTAMGEQVIDLEKAKEDLEKVIKELDAKIKKQFGDVFTHIAEEFNRYFQILFNGGRANLTLGEDEEGNYGIEITANPPGKKLQSLNVLSGGERTLTSLALVFAILSINPSPFCLLDEVDAALDESNTIRFTKILEDLRDKTQFLVISHNRDTMKVADSLYGITMDNDHVSKLISIRLAEALEKVA